jgi:hypothetical protein
MRRWSLRALRKEEGIDPTIKAHVSYSYAVEKSQKVAGSVGLNLVVDWIMKGPSVEASLTWTRTDSNSLDGNFNINEENKAACGGRGIPRVPVGIFECLKDSTLPIKKNIVAKCEMIRVAAGKLTANGKVKWIFVEAGVQGDFDAKVTYTIKVDAPVKEDKPKVASDGRIIIQ